MSAEPHACKRHANLHTSVHPSAPTHLSLATKGQFQIYPSPKAFPDQCSDCDHNSHPAYMDITAPRNRWMLIDLTSYLAN